MKREPKTANGLQVVARQRAHQNHEVETRDTIIHAGQDGQLIVKSSIGREHGFHVSVAIRLEEILAWLPHLVGRVKDDAAELALAEVDWEILKGSLDAEENCCGDCDTDVRITGKCHDSGAGAGAS